MVAIVRRCVIKTHMSDKPHISFRIDLDIKLALERLAAKDERKLSNFITLVLRKAANEDEEFRAAQEAKLTAAKPKKKARK